MAAQLQHMVQRNDIPSSGESLLMLVSCATLQLTFVVVSKSHGTRLLPHPKDPNSSDTSFGGKSGNVVPGTAVDTLITAPLKYEFFLNSHAGIQVLQY